VGGANSTGPWITTVDAYDPVDGKVTPITHNITDRLKVSGYSGTTERLIDFTRFCKRDGNHDIFQFLDQFFHDILRSVI
jgi:hypothetical protein